MTDIDALDELTYLLHSGSDRTGALDFQSSADVYSDRSAPPANLDDLLSAADKVEAGIALDPELDAALLHGSSIGGARPKALIDDGERKLVAKFSSNTDIHNIVKAEFVAMRLAGDCGLDVAPVELTNALDKTVLLIERFDRHKSDRGWLRRSLVSALTLLGLDDLPLRGSAAKPPHCGRLAPRRVDP